MCLFSFTHHRWASPAPSVSCATMPRKKRFDNKNKSRLKATREDDATWRMTHLLGASQLLSSSSPTLSKFYVRTTRQICRRINMTTDCVTVKRNYCKKCNASLMPGADGVTRRVVNGREKSVVVRCGACGDMKRYLCRDPRESSGGGGINEGDGNVALEGVKDHEMAGNVGSGGKQKQNSMGLAKGRKRTRLELQGSDSGRPVKRSASCGIQ